MRIHHIALGVKNLEESVNFYKKFFGFVEVNRFTKPGWKGSAAILELDGTQLELFNFEEMKEITTSSDLDILGMRHIGIEVDNVDTKYEELKSDNVDIEEPKIGTTCAKFCFLRDPNGISIELYQRKIQT